MLRRLIGADRPKIIAVLGLTRADVEVGVAHARTAVGAYPVQAWCAEDASAAEVRQALREFWPALVLVSWTGKRGDAAFKLLPLTLPPFRVVVFNEARGFFPARPLPLIRHGWHRFTDAAHSGAHYAFDLTLGCGKWTWSLLYRAGQRTRDVFRLLWSLVYRLSQRVLDLILAFLAILAPLTAPASRALYKGLKSGRASVLTPGFRPSSPTSTEIVIHGRSWPRSKVLKSKSDFVIFRRPGETAPAEPLMNLAIELNAFAVAKQIAFTGWRNRVTTKHPFRRLLPGEVTRVEMPFSSLIVMRRDLMPVPRAVTFGAALMRAFHENGWPSYVMGNEDPLTQEPAMPLEDAEFAVRAMGTTRHDSPLARGNVVWSPSHSKPFRGLPRVLVVSPYLPFPLSHGGAVRIYNICRSLKDEVDFILVCFREVTETVRYAELHEVFREVYAIDIDEKTTDPQVPAQIAHYRNTAMSALIRELAQRVDIVQLEFTQMAEYRTCAEGRPTILVEHDITFTLYQQLGRDYDIWLRFETEALRQTDVTWTMSQQDRALAREHGSHRALAVPNGVDLKRFQPQPRETEGQTILFIGAFRHLPNLMAFDALQKIIMPAVWAEFPKCRLHVIAGPNNKRTSNDPRITIQGFVEDVRPAYKECDVVAIPLPVSAGTNIKLMEAMACGRAIVSTAVGCQGLDLEDGADLLVAEIGPEFAEALCRLLRDASLREQIAARARRTAEARFDWDIIAREALHSYHELHSQRPGPDRNSGSSATGLRSRSEL